MIWLLQGPQGDLNIVGALSITGVDAGRFAAVPLQGYVEAAFTAVNVVAAVPIVTIVAAITALAAKPECLGWRRTAIVGRHVSPDHRQTRGSASRWIPLV